MNKQLPQLYLLCEFCKDYFKYDGGKRRRWCTDKCKVAAWRKANFVPVISNEIKLHYRATLKKDKSDTVRFNNPDGKEW